MEMMEQESPAPREGETFGQWVTRVMQMKRLTMSECEQRSGVFRAQWGRIMQDRPRKDGTQPLRRPETIDKVAAGLGVDRNLARRAAGLTPIDDPTLSRLVESASVNSIADGIASGNPDELMKIAQWFRQSAKALEFQNDRLEVLLDRLGNNIDRIVSIR